jgi:hypothetical protein
MADWRWRLAAHLAEGQGPIPRCWSDGWVRRAARFAEALRHCRNADGVLRLPPRMSAIDQAYRLYVGPESLRRWEVEARLLAGESFAQVAAKCDSTPDVIAAYHALFFDVQGSLEACDYIVNVVIGPKAHGGLSEADTEVILKLFGYTYGSPLLDAVLAYYRDPPPERWGDLGPDELAGLRTRLLVKASVVARGLPGDGAALKKLAAVREALDVIGRGQGQGGLGNALAAPLRAVTGYGEEICRRDGLRRSGTKPGPSRGARGERPGCACP